MAPSADLRHAVKAAKPQVERYYKVSRPFAIRLSIMFKHAFPEYWAQYRQAFQAGRWYRIKDDPGPFIGRAIVYKLQVLPHRDGLDGGPAAIFPVGRFKGGELYLPDLDAKLQYVVRSLCQVLGGLAD